MRLAATPTISRSAAAAPLLALSRARPGLQVHLGGACCGGGTRADEARASPRRCFLARPPERRRRAHPTSSGTANLPYVGGRGEGRGRVAKGACEPDIVFTHERDDRHQDHRLVCELTWNTFRDHPIFEYEIPKYDGGLGGPNLFVAARGAASSRRAPGCCAKHSREARLSKHWFDDEVFRGVMRLRGMESATRYAEAFTCRKLPLRPA